MVFPQKITAGLTLKHSINLTAYPASLWAVKAYLRGPSSIDISAEKDGNLHVINVSADVTKNYKSGYYSFSLRAVNDFGEVEEIEAGSVEVITDLAAVTGQVDTRSHAKKTLEALEAVIEGRATLDQERYRLNNRELFRTPLDILIKLRNQYRAEVSREIAKASGKSIFGKVV
ncbi:hypothetical protein ABFP33_20620, partial [Acinetobacter bereziniae]|uniref:hypothetical protein n=1 Tax=Acinetobacter bereziniae TaxID=106648 RepID=UPI0032137BEA